MTWQVELRVVGQPRPQGSKRAVTARNGRTVYLEGANNAAHRAFVDWRAAVAAEARQWLHANGHPPAYDGAVAADLVFYLPKPPSRPKKERLPRTAFDVDKLVRAVFDAVSVDAPLVRNDSRIVDVHARKLWAVDDTPGAHIHFAAAEWNPDREPTQ